MPTFNKPGDDFLYDVADGSPVGVQRDNGAKQMFAFIKDGQVVDANQSPVSEGPTPTAIAARAVVVSAAGDSIVRNMYSPSAAGGPAGTYRRWTGFGAWLMWASFYSGGKFWADTYALEGYSGNRTFQVYNLLQSDTATEGWGAQATAAANSATTQTIAVGLRARTCQIVVDMSGTNDMLYAPSAQIVDGSALQRAIAGRRAIWAYMRTIGKSPAALSLLPREGSLNGGAGTMTQDQLKPYVPTWNAAMKAAAEADGVPWIDAYAVCAAAGGGWKTGYVYHNGADDPTYLHPSLLASMEIGKAAVPVLSSMIASAPAIPRILLGASEIYNNAFVAGDPRTFYDNFDSGLFPSTEGWGLNFDPQGDSTLTVFTPTQDVSGGGTLRLRKPSSASTGYASYLGPSKTVAAGQERLFIFDVRFVSFDSFSSFAVKIVDRTSGSTSINQPIASLDISGREAPALTAWDTGVGRFVLYYKIPTGITTIAPMLEINRAAGGAAGGFDELYVSNMPQIRLS
jgi:hypothetical protein